MQTNAFQLNAFQQDGLPAGQYSLVCETGVFLLTGNAANLTVSRTLALESGSFALSGQAATLTARRVLTAETGVFALSGQDVTFVAPAKLTAETGYFSFDGQSARFVYTPVQTQTSGGFLVSTLSERRRLRKEEEQAHKRVEEAIGVSAPLPADVGIPAQRRIAGRITKAALIGEIKKPAEGPDYIGIGRKRHEDRMREEEELLLL